MTPSYNTIYRLLDEEELLELAEETELWLLVEALVVEEDVLVEDADVVLVLETDVLLAADVLMLLALVVETLEAEELLEDLFFIVPNIRAIFLQLSVRAAPESFSA